MLQVLEFTYFILWLWPLAHLPLVDYGDGFHVPVRSLTVQHDPSKKAPVGGGAIHCSLPPFRGLSDLTPVQVPLDFPCVTRDGSPEARSRAAFCARRQAGSESCPLLALRSFSSRPWKEATEKGNPTISTLRICGAFDGVDPCSLPPSVQLCL